MQHRGSNARVIGGLTFVMAIAGFAACGSSRDPADDPKVDAGTPVPAEGGTPVEAGAPVEGGPTLDAAGIPECVEATGTENAAARKLDDATGSASVEVNGAACARTFTLRSTANRVDNLPASPRVVTESSGRPTVHTKNDLFDALYQLAIAEAKECSVSEIKDGAFRNGGGLTCPTGGCFETGRKWTYVWTRDTSYAVDLGLAWLDPVRAKNSLDFKLSARRSGGDLQIVQDTGTGGSYPVSTDRAIWALGAREALRHLSGADRVAFAGRALEAIKNTLDHDRAVAFDPTDGLYRGEQSFLDWREQTYPRWTVPDLVHIGMSKSLSTNAAHLALMITGAELAGEKGDAAESQRLGKMASDLRAAMRTRFWLAEDKQLSTYVTTELDGAPARRFDLLGTSLAVLLDVTTPEQARDAIASYPTLAHGPPVIFPQQKDTPIYHNRAIWPFVTAYWVRAARKADNDAAFDSGVRSLVRGAALNLSNMENLEAVTGKPFHEDGANSGPVVNSQRQLWSVAGYLAMVHAIFGVDATERGLRVAPYVTRGLRRSLFSTSKTLTIDDLPYRGKTLNVVVSLPNDPAPAGGGAYRVASVRLNGAEVAAGEIAETALLARNLVEVELAAPSGAGAQVRTITDTSDYKTIFGPRTPAITGLALDAGKVRLTLDRAGEDADVSVDVYRDGARVAQSLPGATASWTDTATSGDASPSHCYTIELRYASGGNRSQRSAPSCFWGSGFQRIASLPATSFTANGGTASNNHGRFHYEAWGDAGHILEATFTATRTGAHLIQAVYGNGAGALNTGITCAVKRVTVQEVGGTATGAGYMFMPQRADWASWGDSSFVRVTLQAGKSYRVRLEHDQKSVNMSAFSHFNDYTGGTGGAGGAFSRVNIAELKVLSLVP
ncbi:MAG TPA: hypothetical protein PK141_07220 [Polyangiaceae bacterium]|nr:hypothetical protein [Polyangiaceae bacterium]